MEEILMKFQISKSLCEAFNEGNKNYNYSLSFLLSSIELDNCSKYFGLIEEFKLGGDCVTVEIDDSNADIIRTSFDDVNNALIERLLWVSILFPEI